MTVFYTEEDEQTAELLQWFDRYKIANLRWNWIELPIEQLCRRSIGRNLAALGTEADWIWFCDADYLFSDLCWSAFAAAEFPDAPLIYPREFQTQKNVAYGDKLIELAAQKKGLLCPHLRRLKPQRYNRAIGGIQILKGEIARTIGYLNHHAEAQCPRGDGIWRRTFEDVWFRKRLGTNGVAAEIPGVFRIRHSNTGRNTEGLRL